MMKVVSETLREDESQTEYKKRVERERVKSFVGLKMRGKFFGTLKRWQMRGLGSG